ncbi:Leucine-rich repeat [Dillenia turbinata]|uniref:Leucine-rich repeat n=1 Tax=Dillenia turbinata TaxID=194707 RepID=A0AAN8Z171_9MAGN
MENSRLFLVLCLFWSSFILGTHELQSSQTQVLLQLKKQLEDPKQLDIWSDHGMDFCYTPSSDQLNVSCQDNSVTELRIVGDKLAKVGDFDGCAIPNQTLSESFSMDSFVTTLTRLTSLRVVRLVSLGIWGPLPDKIHRLGSLEFLDLSSNFLFGSIPPKMSTMVKLQTLVLDENYLNGSIPNMFGSMSNLTILSMRSNRLEGSFPPVEKVKNLNNFTLSYNMISGKVPDLSGLTSLQMLDLAVNKLDSDLPSLPKGLVMALLSNNSFSGEIPKQYTQLGRLQRLDLSSNVLKGTPQAGLFSLPAIAYLNLASNMLSGSLPNSLSCGEQLNYVDISNNKFTGGLPSCLNSTTSSRVIKLDGNCLSTNLQDQHPESYCVELKVKGKKSGSGRRDLGVLIGVIGGILVVAVFLAIGFFVVCRRYCPKGISEQHLLPKAVQDNSAAGFSSEILTSARYIAEASKLGMDNVPICRLFSLEELKVATNNFDRSTSIGEGSIGKLYKGRLENGTVVAIRCLSLSKTYSIRNLKLRLDMLAKLRHQNLVCLLGYSIDGVGKIGSNVNRLYLVYEFVSGGDFRSHLSETSPEKVLKWSERLSVLIGVAKAVHFLHTGVIPGFLNNHLKTNNVLLNKHRMAKLSDYGLSIITREIDRFEAKGEGPTSWQMTNLVDDVYSFGFILLESLVGASTYVRREASLLKEMASFGSQDGRRRLIDPIILGTCSQESLSVVISIMTKCISSESATRPSFEDVLWNLQYAAQIQATADGDQRFGAMSPP